MHLVTCHDRKCGLHVQQGYERKERSLRVAQMAISSLPAEGDFPHPHPGHTCFHN